MPTIFGDDPGGGGPGSAARAILVIALLLTTAVGSPVMSGTAAAASTTSTTNSACPAKGEPGLVETTLLAGIPAYVDAAGDMASIFDDACSVTAKEAQDKSHADLYSYDLSTWDTSDAYLTTHENWEQEMRTTAMGRARMAVAKAINAGKSKSQVVYDAKQAVHQYYAMQQRQLIQSYERHARSIYYTTRSGYTSEIMTLHLVAGSQEGADTPDETNSYWKPSDGLDTDNFKKLVFFGGQGGELLQSSSDSTYHSYTRDGTPRNVTVKLANGNTTTVPVLGFPEAQEPDQSQPWTAEWRTTAMMFAPTNHTVTNDSATWTDAAGNQVDPNDNSVGQDTAGLVRVVAQSPTGDTSIVFRSERYRNAWVRLGQQDDQMVANAGTFAREAYAAYTSGDISLTEVAGPGNIAARAASDYQSTGYYAFVSTSLAAAGVSTDFNTSMQMDVTREQQPDPWVDPQVHNAPADATVDGGNVTVSHPTPYGGRIDFDGNSAGKITIPVTENGVDVSGVSVTFTNSSGGVIKTVSATSPDTTDTSGTDTYSVDLSSVSGLGTAAGHTDISIAVHVQVSGSSYTTMSTVSYATTSKTTYNNVTGQFLVSQDGFKISKNTTYTAGAINGSEWVVMQDPQDGNGSVIYGLRADDTVHIDSMTNIQTGKSISNTTTQKRVYKNINGSKLQQQLNDLQKLLAEYGQQQTAGGTGSLFGSGGLSAGLAGGLLILAAAGVIVLLVLD
ncbi:MAG: hypothetical protein ABEJ94_06790 [Halorientalis sp.]